MAADRHREAYLGPEGPLPPWWRQPWSRLQDTRGQDRMPHALLVAGEPGLGKSRFAAALAASLLCEAPGEDGRACRRCRSCIQVAAGAHPDLHRLEPEEGGRSLRIDQVRELAAALALTGQYGGWRIGILQPAEAMTLAAANSLLKTLEEPGAETVLILVSAYPGLLPATVRSRCQQLRLAPPDPTAGLEWLWAQGLEDAAPLLQAAGGAPYRALELAEPGVRERRRESLEDWLGVVRGRADASEVAARWGREGFEARLVWLQGWIEDLLRLRLAAGAGLRSVAEEAALQGLAEGLDLGWMFEQLERVRELRRLALGGQLNRPLQLEALLLPWRGRARGGPHQRRTRA